MLMEQFPVKAALKQKEKMEKVVCLRDLSGMLR